MLVIKENLMVALALIALLLVSGCMNVLKNETTKRSLEKSLEQCNEGYNDQDTKDICYSSVAEVNQDLSICEKVQDQRRKDYCYYNVAKATQNLSICEKIQTQDPKDLCLNETRFFLKN